jgi:hypothetical protein
MVKTYTISTIEDAVELAMQLRRYSFRGHSRCRLAYTGRASTF